MQIISSENNLLEITKPMKRISEQQLIGLLVYWFLSLGSLAAAELSSGMMATPVKQKTNNNNTS